MKYATSVIDDHDKDDYYNNSGNDYNLQYAILPSIGGQNHPVSGLVAIRIRYTAPHQLWIRVWINRI